MKKEYRLSRVILVVLTLITVLIVLFGFALFVFLIVPCLQTIIVLLLRKTL